MGPHFPTPIRSRRRSIRPRPLRMVQQLEPRLLLSTTTGDSLHTPPPPVSTAPSASLFLSTSTSDATHGSAITLVAHVVVNGAASPEGLLLDFVDQDAGSTTILATVPIHNNTATITWDAGATGDHQIVADLETGQSIPAAQSAPQEVTISPTATQTTLTVTKGALVATVTSSAPDAISTGSVSFFQGTKILATLPVNADGTVTFPASLLHSGKHAIVAAYNGSAQFSPSTAGKFTWTVSSATHASASGSSSGQGSSDPSDPLSTDILFADVRRLRPGSAAVGRRGVAPLSLPRH